MRTFTVMIWVLIPIITIGRHRMLVYCSAALVGRVAAVFACPLLYRRVFREAAPQVLKEEERLEQLIKQQKSVNGEEYEKK